MGTSPLELLLAEARLAQRVTHIERIPARLGHPVSWPEWAPASLIERYGELGIQQLWTHQRRTADLAHERRHVVVATGTASGKSLAYQLPMLAELLRGEDAGRPVTALYLAPTKALGVDQLRSIRALRLPGVRAAVLDGDTPGTERNVIRTTANLIITNPDLLHHTLLPGHERWSGFLRRLTHVIVDECHAYRGVFGSHIALVIRRLRRLAARYGADPTFILASATVTEPDRSASRLIGAPVEAVTADGSPHGPVDFVLWEPPLQVGGGELGAPLRRSTIAETADILTALVLEGVRSLAFVRSRRAAETVSALTRNNLDEIATGLAQRVTSYRAGYLASERREIEAGLQSGELLAVAATNALELGVDISGLDAIVLAGYPGTRASMWQQAGRAGRSGGEALAVMVGRDDPLDTYLVHHPEALFDAPVEKTIVDPGNPYILMPHLAAAASELPLTEADAELFGPHAPQVLEQMERAGLVRRRATGWHWVRRDRASDLANLRGAGSPVRIVEESTGRMIGTVDGAAALGTVHAGAVHVHLGETYLIDSLDLEDRVALATRTNPGYSTQSRVASQIRIVDGGQSWSDGRELLGRGVGLHLGAVEVTDQVVGFLRRAEPGGEVIDEVALDLPATQLLTQAVWYTVSDALLEEIGLEVADRPGAAHAAEHAAIGMLPLLASCDRWDIGGVSTARHEDTGLLTVFVYDGFPGGVGFAERGFEIFRDWASATVAAVEACECFDGCPSCVQSPKCGNGNDPLDKFGALTLLRGVMAGLE